MKANFILSAHLLLLERSSITKSLSYLPLSLFVKEVGLR